MSKAVSAVVALSLMAVFAYGARAATLAELTAELDRAETTAEFARLAAGLDIMAAGGTPESVPALVQLGRAYYLMGEAEGDEKRRSTYLDRAVDASDRALKLSPGEPYALYWRSMAYLQKADMDGGISALGMVKRALRDFGKVESKAPAYDAAGAYRSHGKVLVEAPAWAFIGDDEKGVMLLEKAKEIAPGSLLNRLYLAEAYKETGRKAEAVRELEYIANAPLNAMKPKDDIKTKEEAAALLDKLRR